MQRSFSLFTVLGLCLCLCAPAMAQEKPREQKLPSPLTAGEIAALKLQTKEVVNLFRDTCFNLAGDTDKIVGQVLVSGMRESLFADTLKTDEERQKGIRNFEKYFEGQQISLRLEKEPWKCKVFSAGALDTAVIDAANNIYRELYTDPAYANLEVVNIPDTKDFDKTHSIINVDRADGAHFMLRITYGGEAADRVVLSLNFTPPRQRRNLPEYLALELGEEQMKLPAPQRNSKIAMAVLKNACVDSFGDFAAISKWAALYLSEDDEFIIDETQGTWIAEDKDVSIMLHAESNKNAPCKISGSSVDANMLHRDFQEMLTAHANAPGQSIAANQYSSIKYKDKPNAMPEAVPYYSGAILRKNKQEIGIDIVLSTKRKDDKVFFNIDVKPTTER